MSRIGAGWLRRTKTGEDMITISLDALPVDGQLILFVNREKQDAKHPDYIVHTSRPKKDGKQQSGSFTEEDIPF